MRFWCAEITLRALTTSSHLITLNSVVSSPSYQGGKWNANSLGHVPMGTEPELDETMAWSRRSGSKTQWDKDSYGSCESCEWHRACDTRGSSTSAHHILWSWKPEQRCYQLWDRDSWSHPRRPLVASKRPIVVAQTINLPSARREWTRVRTHRGCQEEVHSDLKVYV